MLAYFHHVDERKKRDEKRSIELIIIDLCISMVVYERAHATFFLQVTLNNSMSNMQK